MSGRMPATIAAPRFEEVGIGAAIGPLTLPPVSRLELALFAGAAADPNPIHLDDAAARQGGLPGVIVYGMLSMAFLGRLLTRWAPQRCIRSFSARFVAMAYPGDVITCTGTVVAKASHEGENRVELDLTAQNQNGERILLGKASVALP